MSQLALNCSTVREIVPWVKGSQQRKVIFRIMDSNTDIYKQYISSSHPYRGHNNKWFVPNMAFFNLFCSDWSHYYVGQDPPISNFVNLSNKAHLQIHWAIDFGNMNVIENSASLVEAESKYWANIRAEARGQLIEVQMTKLCDSKNLTYAALFYRWMATILLTRVMQSNPMEYVDDPSDTKRIYTIVSDIESACANAPPGIKGRTIEGYCSNLAKWYLIMHTGSPLYEYGQVLRKSLKENSINVNEFTLLPIHKWFSAIVLLQGVTEKEKILKLKTLLHDLCKATGISICIEILAALEPLIRNVAKPASVGVIKIDTPIRCENSTDKRDISYQENGKVYCFELKQLIDILKSPNPVNPHTGNKFDGTFAEKMLRKFTKPSAKDNNNNNSSLCTSCKNIIKNQPLRWGMMGDDAQKIVYEYCSMECFEVDEDNIKALGAKKIENEAVIAPPAIDFDKFASQRDNVMTKFYGDLLQKLLDKQDNMLNKQQDSYKSIVDKIENLQRDVAEVQSKQEKRFDNVDAKLGKLSEDLQSSNKTVESLSQFVHGALQNDKLEQKIESIISRALAANSKLQNNAIFNRIQQAVDDIKFSQRENVENVQKLLSQLPPGADKAENTLDLLQNVTATVQNNAKQLENLQNHIQRLSSEIPTKIVNELGQVIKHQTDILQNMRTELPTLWAESAKKLETQLKDTANEIIAKIVDPIDLLLQKALNGFLQELKVANSLFNNTSNPDVQAAALLELAQQRVADTYNALIEQIKTLTEQSSSGTKEILSNLADKAAENSKLLANVLSDNKESVQNAIGVWNSLANKVEKSLQEVNQKLSGLTDAEKNIANRLIAWQQTDHVKNPPPALLENNVSDELEKQSNNLQSLDTKVTTLQTMLENIQNSDTVLNKAHLLQLEAASEKPEIIPEVESAINEKKQNNFEKIQEISPEVPEYLLNKTENQNLLEYHPDDKPQYDIDIENSEPYVENKFEINDAIASRYDLESEEKPVETPIVENEVESPIEAQTPIEVESPIENEVQTPIENEVQSPMENEVQTPIENEAQTPIEVESPIENEVQTPIENEVQSPMENEVQTPIENEVESPTENAVETPMENEVESPTENEVESPTENEVESPMENEVQSPIENKVESPTENAVENAVETPVVEKSIENDDEFESNVEVPKLNDEDLKNIRNELKKLKDSAAKNYLDKFNIKAFNPIWAERYIESKETDNEILGQESPQTLLLFVAKLMLIIARYITRDPNILRLSDKRTLEKFNTFVEKTKFSKVSDKIDPSDASKILKVLLNLPYIRSKKISGSVKQFFNIKQDKIPIDLVCELLLKEAYQRNSYFEDKFKNIIDNVIPVIKKKFSAFFSENAQYLLQVYGTIIEGIHNDNSNILSYIKIRNDDEGKWNQRFKLHTDNTNKILTVQYNDSQIPFYAGKSPIWNAEYENNFVRLTPAAEFRVYYNHNSHTMTVTEANNDKKIIQKWSNVALDEALIDWRSEKIGLIEKYSIAIGSENSIYQNTYLFGPFTEIFDRTVSLGKLAEKSYKQIEPLLIENKSICVVGYGASGAGKTSTLIRTVYKDNNGNVHEEDGVAVHWCNMLPADKWKYLKVIVKEFQNEVVEQKTVVQKAVVQKADKTFERSDKTWMSARQSLSKFLEVQLSDENRKIHATPNNIVSSRSHVIIYIKLLEAENSEILNAPCIAICDFAGVENKFECDNPDVLKRFLNLPLALNENGRAYDALIKENFESQTWYIIANLINIFNNKDGKNDVLEGRAKMVEILREIVAPNGNTLNIITKNKRDFKQYDNFNNFYISYAKDENTSSLDETKKGPLNALETLDFLLKFCVSNFVVSAKGVEMEPEKFANSAPVSRTAKNLNNSENLKKSKIKTDKVAKKPDLQAEGLLPKASEIKLTPDTKLEIGSVAKYYNSSEFKWIMNILQKRTKYGNIALKTPVAKDNWERSLHQIIIFIILRIWHDTEHAVIAEECKKRTLEGTFINQSLFAMRAFIQQLGRHQDTVPGFIDQCLPLQCNPYYNQCLGTSDNTEWQKLAATDERGGNVLEMIGDLKSTLGLLSSDRKDKVVFCLMNILNISKERNNPPNPPYFDITDLLLEQNRLVTLRDKNNVLDNTSTEVHNIDSSILSEFELRTKVQREVLDKTTQHLINNRIKELKSQHTDHISILAGLLDLVNTINSNSAIGTMVAVDQMVKFGEQLVSCNLRYKLNKDHDYFNEYNSFLQTLLKKYNQI